MCANQLEIMNNIIPLIKLGIDFFHFDVMDGVFVNNLALNFDIIKEVRQLTRVPFDVHLMVQKPSQYFDQLIKDGADIIIFHVECSEDIQKNINHLKSKNVKVGLALNLETLLSDVEKYLPYLDYLLIMNVKTGFSGQKFDNKVLKKTNYFYSYIQNKGYDIKIISDGGIKLEYIEPLYNNGVDIIVAGTSILFNNKGFSKNLEEFRRIKLDPKKRKIKKSGEDPSKIKYKAAILKEINKLEVVEKTLRHLKEDEVVVKVMSCGICGSDLIRVYKKGMHFKNLVPGHEFSGTVIKTSDSTKDLLNKRVVVFPLIPCKKCNYCKQEKYNLCENYDYLGSRNDGGFSELVVTPKDNVLLIPHDISYDEASLIEPLAVAYRGVTKLSNLINSNILILGLGPIGILTGMICKKLGADKVEGFDRNGYKGDIAKKVGFANFISPNTNIQNKKFDILIDCCGSSELINKYICNLEKEGSILMLGNHEKSFSLSPETMSILLRSEFKIVSSWNSNISDNIGNDWRVCINYLSRKELNLKPLITHTYSLKDINVAFDDIVNKKIKYLKVIINPN